MLDKDKTIQEDFEPTQDQTDSGAKGGQSEATDETIPKEEYTEESDQR